MTVQNEKKVFEYNHDVPMPKSRDLRKVIQMQTFQHPGEWPALIVLCSDGTIWSRNLVGYDQKWNQIDVPPC